MLYKSNGKHVSFEFIRVKEEASISFEKNHFDLVEILFAANPKSYPREKKKKKSVIHFEPLKK